MHASRIEAVTVYRRGARVSRVLELELGGACPDEIRIEGLPLCLDDGSVRARVEATDEGAGELPVAAEVKVALSVGGEDASLAPADDEALEKCEDEVERLGQVLAQIAQDIADLERLGLHARPPREEGKPPEPSPIAARVALLGLRGEIQIRLLAEQRATRAELRRAKKRLAELRDRDRRGSSARRPRTHELRKSVIVGLRKGAGKGAGRARLVLEYSVPGARWAPAYTLRLDASHRRVTLQLRAQVAQNTGEDWTAARVTFSTAAADAWTELPELHSKRIGRRQEEPPRRGWRAPPAGADALYADYDQSVRRRELPAGDVLLREDLEDTGVLEQARGFLSDAPTAIPPPRQAPTGRVAPVPAAPPPPHGAPPMSAMAPQGAPMMQTLSKRKSAGLLGNLLGASAGGFGAPAAAEMARGRALTSSLAEEMDELGDADDARMEAGLAEPAGLDYGRMRMSPPDSDMRGELTLVGQHQIYLELLVTQTWLTQIHVESAVAQAMSQAGAIDDELLSPGHHLAWSGTYDYAYRTDAPIDVPSDGEFHNVAVTSADGKASIRHVVVPRESTDVYRLARIENPLRTPLMEGPVDVYVGTEYLLTSQVRFTPASGRLTVGLGADQGVKVARNARFREESAGLMGGSLVLDHRIEVEVQNHTGGNIELEIRERVPVIREEEDEIKLEVKEVIPRWEEYDPDPQADGEPRLRGGHRWRISLTNGETKKLTAGYAVKIASKYELVGGNRREA